MYLVHIGHATFLLLKYRDSCGSVHHVKLSCTSLNVAEYTGPKWKQHLLAHLPICAYCTSIGSAWMNIGEYIHTVPGYCFDEHRIHIQKGEMSFSWNVTEKDSSGGSLINARRPASDPVVKMSPNDTRFGLFQVRRQVAFPSIARINVSGYEVGEQGIETFTLLEQRPQKW